MKIRDDIGFGDEVVFQMRRMRAFHARLSTIDKHFELMCKLNIIDAFDVPKSLGIVVWDL